jgi:hypothetical protein
VYVVRDNWEGIPNAYNGCYFWEVGNFLVCTFILLLKFIGTLSYLPKSHYPEKLITNTSSDHTADLTVASQSLEAQGGCPTAKIPCNNSYFKPIQSGL